MWATSVCVENFIDYFSKDERPGIAIEHVDQWYDNKENPTVGRFSVKFKNVGEKDAYRCSTNHEFFLDDDVLKISEGGTIAPIIQSGITFNTQFAIDGDLFKQIWDQNSVFRVLLKVTCFDKNDKKYIYNQKIKYKPHSETKHLEPTWGPE